MRVAPAALDLLIASNINTEVNSELIKAFQAQTGLRVEVFEVKGGSRDLAGRLKRGDITMNGRKPDIVLGGTVEVDDELGEKCLAKVSLQGEMSIPNDLRNDYWKAWYRGFLCVICSEGEELCGKSRVSWDDLFAISLEKLAIPDPAYTTGGFVFMATQIETLEDEEKAFDRLAKLKRGAYLARTSVDIIERVAQGQSRVGVTFWHDAMRRKEKSNLTIQIVVPKHTGTEVGAASIMIDAPNRENAERFLGFLLTSKAAAINEEFGWRLLVVPGETGTWGYPFDAVDLLKGGSCPSDRSEWIEKREGWIKRWEAL